MKDKLEGRENSRKARAVMLFLSSLFLSPSWESLNSIFGLRKDSKTPKSGSVLKKPSLDVRKGEFRVSTKDLLEL